MFDAYDQRRASEGSFFFFFFFFLLLLLFVFFFFFFFFFFYPPTEKCMQSPQIWKYRLHLELEEDTSVVDLDRNRENLSLFCSENRRSALEIFNEMTALILLYDDT